MVSPFCGLVNLQRGTAVLAYADAIFAILFLIQNAVGITYYAPRAMEEYSINIQTEDGIEKVPRIYSMKLVLVLLNSFYWSCTLCLSVLLITATKQRDLRKCRQWFICTLIISVLFLVDIMMQAFSQRATPFEIISPVTATLLLTYSVLAVMAFMEEMRLGGCVPLPSKSYGEVAT